MLKWREDYYVGEGIKDAEKTKKRIDAGKVALGVYLVTLSENPGNLLEIIPSYMLIQKSYYAKCPEIIGMAKGKDEATDLAVDIVKNIYGETGAFQVKEYFKNRGAHVTYTVDPHKVYIDSSGNPAGTCAAGGFAGSVLPGAVQCGRREGRRQL